MPALFPFRYHIILGYVQVLVRNDVPLGRLLGGPLGGSLGGPLGGLLGGLLGGPLCVPFYFTIN